MLEAVTAMGGDICGTTISTNAGRAVNNPARGATCFSPLHQTALVDSEGLRFFLFHELRLPFAACKPLRASPVHCVVSAQRAWTDPSRPFAACLCRLLHCHPALFLAPDWRLAGSACAGWVVLFRPAASVSFQLARLSARPSLPSSQTQHPQTTGRMRSFRGACRSPTGATNTAAL